MKKSIKIIAVALVAVMLCMSLAACGKKLSGEYKLDVTIMDTGTVTTYKFSGSKVTFTTEAKVAGSIVGDPVVIEGKYSIEDDKITFEFESDDADAEKLSGTFDFEETENGIKIGILEYKKA